MEIMELNFEYRGALIEAKIYYEENCFGVIYPIELNNNYAFTIYSNERQDWEIMRENDGNTPSVEAELLSSILKKLQWQLKYAA
jgi:hypothetical protein